MSTMNGREQARAAVLDVVNTPANRARLPEPIPPTPLRLRFDDPASSSPTFAEIVEALGLSPERVTVGRALCAWLDGKPTEIPGRRGGTLARDSGPYSETEVKDR